MASADIPLSSRLQEEIKCAICLGELRVPRVLTCVHSFCQSCLETYQKEKGTPGKITCPVCKEETLLTDAGLSDLKHDFRAITLMDCLQKEKQRDQKEKKFSRICEICGNDDSEGGASYVFCSECQQVMCTQCGNMHIKMRIAQNHTLTEVSSNSVQSGSVPGSKLGLGRQGVGAKSVFCKKHENKTLDLFCTFCLIPVCQECSAMDHRTKDNHECVTIDGFAPTMKEEILSRLKRTAQVQERNREMLSKIEQERVLVNTDKNRRNKKIESEISRCTHRVKSDLTTKNEMFFQHQNLSLTQLKKEVEDRERCIEKCRLTTAEIIDQRENYRLAAAYKELLTSLDHILSDTADHSKLTAVRNKIDLRFQLINDEPLIGSLVFTSIQRKSIPIDELISVYSMTFTQDGRLAVLASFSGPSNSQKEFKCFTKYSKDNYKANTHRAYEACTYNAIKQTTSNPELASELRMEIKLGKVFCYSHLASLSDLRFVLISKEVTGQYAENDAYYVPKLTGSILDIVTDHKDNIYCSVENANRIYVLRTDESPTKSIPTGSLTPQRIAVCPRSPDQIMFTHDSSKVSVVDWSGKLLRTITRREWRDVAIGCDNDRLLYVLWKDEAGLRTLQRFNMNGDLFDTLFIKEKHSCSKLLLAVSPGGMAAVITAARIYHGSFHEWRFVLPLSLPESYVGMVTLISATREFTGHETDLAHLTNSNANLR